ncbi:hypothetical protein K402DRAFT_228625 [Aulographum hederae CBS 113979]|uniref:Uncharacterized protein n=1 Tax=Aulographum hederae CBS 113979 TaxID=1176131 RepID=A0A6G1HBU4_9PEZI|nr:hypothetical protein K402DRAFT_228625 [Aulographum hederae CBS 113979]
MQWIANMQWTQSGTSRRSRAVKKMRKMEARNRQHAGDRLSTRQQQRESLWTARAAPRTGTSSRVASHHQSRPVARETNSRLRPSKHQKPVPKKALPKKSIPRTSNPTKTNHRMSAAIPSRLNGHSSIQNAPKTVSIPDILRNSTRREDLLSGQHPSISRHPNPPPATTPSPLEYLIIVFQRLETSGATTTLSMDVASSIISETAHSRGLQAVQYSRWLSLCVAAGIDVDSEAVWAEEMEEMAVQNEGTLRAALGLALRRSRERVVFTATAKREQREETPLSVVDGYYDDEHDELDEE